MAQTIVLVAKVVQGKPGVFLDNAVRENARRINDKLSKKNKAGKVKVAAAC